MEYQCRGFLEKNRDALYEELVDIMRASKVIKGPIFLGVKFFHYITVVKKSKSKSKCNVSLKPTHAALYFISF